LLIAASFFLNLAYMQLLTGKILKYIYSEFLSIFVGFVNKKINFYLQSQKVSLEGTKQLVMCVV